MSHVTESLSLERWICDCAWNVAKQQIISKRISSTTNRSVFIFVFVTLFIEQAMNISKTNSFYGVLHEPAEFSEYTKETKNTTTVHFSTLLHILCMREPVSTHRSNQLSPGKKELSLPSNNPFRVTARWRDLKCLFCSSRLKNCRIQRLEILLVP